MLLDIGYTIGFRLVKDFGSFFHGNENDEESEVRDGVHFFCFLISFPRLMIPLAIVMETADSGGCQNFWHPPLSAYLTWIRRKPQIIKFMKNWLRRAKGSCFSLNIN